MVFYIDSPTIMLETIFSTSLISSSIPNEMYINRPTGRKNTILDDIRSTSYTSLEKELNLSLRPATASGSNME